MKSRQILIAIAILATLLHTAAAQPKKEIEAKCAPAGDHSGGYKLAVQSCSVRFDCDRSPKYPWAHKTFSNHTRLP